jgi:uncharacterized pyridoxamine 5'-phosphate oxidase family protein
MKRMFLVLSVAAAAAAVISLSQSLAAQDQSPSAGVKKVFEFVRDCGSYFIATTEGDQPRVRPFSSWFLYQGKLYIQTGRSKNVGKQILANPKIEICAYDGKGAWIRITAVAEEDGRVEAQQYALDQMPELKDMYKAGDGNTAVFYLKDATAVYTSYAGDSWTEKF